MALAEQQAGGFKKVGEFFAGGKTLQLDGRKEGLHTLADISFLSTRIVHTNDKDDNHLDLAVSRGNLEIFKKCR